LGKAGFLAANRKRWKTMRINATQIWARMEQAMWASILSEWASLIFRWLHVIAAIGWIGSSFYFIHLDLELKPREGLPEGAHGEAWQVHGGGFYHIIKFLVAPAKMPSELTWFKWEAYTTWLSGFVLMVIVYYLDAELFLVDKSVLNLTPTQAALFSFGSLALAWLLYEAACRSGLSSYELPFAIGGDHRHHHGCQRLRADHPEPEESDRGVIGRRETGSEIWQAGQGTLGPQQLSDAAGRLSHDQQPLPADLWHPL
jgi:hypothetical protein